MARAERCLHLRHPPIHLDVTSIEPADPADPLDELAPLLSSGNEAALAGVYREFAPALRSILLLETRNAALADDLLGETFLELVRDRQRLEFDGEAPGRRLRAYLVRAARNNLIDWRRKAARREDKELTDTVLEGHLDEAATPEDLAVLGAELAAALERLAGLSDPQREVLELRFIAGLSVAEVAEATGNTVGAVKALQHRAVRRLARLSHAQSDEA